MARPFSNAEARNLIAEHKNMINGLYTILRDEKDILEEVNKAVDALVAGSVFNVLRGVPVDELNRDKSGIRIKALVDFNYTTIADLAFASVNQIASIPGISADSAYRIGGRVNYIVNETRKNVKIKLSVDDKNKSSTALVLALANYMRIRPISSAAKPLAAKADDIELAIAHLEEVIGGLRWMFSSSSKKDDAIRAYENLTDRLNGVYGDRTRELLEQYNTFFNYTEEEAWEEFEKNSIAFFTMLENICPGLLGNSDSKYGLPEDLAREIQDECFFPDGLLCTLRRYQEWGVKYALHQERVLLGDEMGLGKTVQAIATMVSLKNTGATHFVVVCPASVLTNWCREVGKMSRLKVTKVHGTNKKSQLKSWIKTGGVAVTTYETTGIFELPDDLKINLMVVDEAHYIKNPKARRTQNVQMLCDKSDRLLFMTGTALENKVEEMITLIRMLQPQIASEVQHLSYMSHAPQFREKVAPVYYRRKREDVLTELPEKTEVEEWCTLSPEEEHVYEEAAYAKNVADMRRVSWNVDDLKYSSKAQRLLELVNEAKEDGRKIIVFSFYLDTIRKVMQLLGPACMPPINGSVNPNRRQEIIDEFDKAPAGAVLLAQINAGGTGLNIQSASVIIFCEPQFKPSIENQAISRAYRMGQTRKVLVYRLLCEDCIDERMMQLLADKQREFDAFADKSVAAQESIELDKTTVGNIIEEEIERIQRKKAQNEKSV